METDDGRMRILERLDRGEIDAKTAMRLLEGEAGSTQQSEVPGQKTDRRWNRWWMLPFMISVGITVLGGGIATLGGWWWVCASTLILVGIVAMTILAASARSPWVHLRVHTGQVAWPRRIALSVPIPIDLSSWFLQKFGERIPALKRTGVDELLLALDALKRGLPPDDPLWIAVEEGEGGERIEVFFD